MKGAFEVEGVDQKNNTVLLEVDRSILAPVANLLQAAPEAQGNNTHVAIRSLGGHIRNAAKVLYGEAKAEQFGFTVLVDETEEPEAEVHTGTG